MLQAQTFENLLSPLRKPVNNNFCERTVQT